MLTLPALEAALARVAVDLLASLGTGDHPVVEFADASELGRAIPFAAGEAAQSVEELLKTVEAVVRYSVRTDHPRFFNQNFAGADPVAVLGDWLGAALNTTSATFEAAPVFTLLERALTSRMAELAGWGSRPLNDPLTAGVFCPGGSSANAFAMQAARRRADPDVLHRGAAGGPRLVAFTSDHAHYSIDKAVRLLGIGADNLVRVACDNGAMRPDALRLAMKRTLAEGAVPFFVNATAGTTVLGAFDPLDAIADVVADHPGAWLHVDGAVGGACLFSPRERGRLAGVERADSLTWNLHKLSGVTQQCSALLMRDPEQLRATFSTRSEYLFQPDKNNVHLDAGDLTFQCARRNDALKGWLTWKARGETHFAARVDGAVDLAQKLDAWIEARPDFVLAAPRAFSHVCFWWVPPELRPLRRSAKADQILGAVAPRIKDAMQRGGEALVGYQPIDGGPNAWRLLLNNPMVTWEDVEAVMELIARLGVEAVQ